jgi:hypothetical protein
MERRLAAILAADVAGYTRLMGVDEAGTLGRLRDYSQSRQDRVLQSRQDRVLIEDVSLWLPELLSDVIAEESNDDVL